MWFGDRLRATLWRCRAIVWTAGYLVPPDDRALWRSTQERRFWHWCHFLAESGQLTAQNRLSIARACWALYPEAFWLRFDRDRFHSRVRDLIGSPVALLSALTILTGALLYVSGIVPAARIAFSAPVAQADRVVVISLDGKGINGQFSRTRSDTLIDLASIWGKSKFDVGLTAFSWGPATLLLPSQDLPINSARVGPEFFSTVGVKATLGRTFTAADQQDCPACVVLSYSVWRHEFRSDPNILGRHVVLNGAQRMVIGVLPANFRLLSPGIAVWTLLDPAILFTNFQRRVGAVARLQKDATPTSLQRDLSELTENAGYVHPSSQIQVTSIAAQVKRTLVSTIWFVLLGIGCAFLVVVLRRSFASLGRLPEGAFTRVLWLGFLAAKSSLVLALAALLSWSLVHWGAVLIAGSAYPLADEYSIWLFLPAAILALSWSIADQQHRCRACLRRLELPVEIGRPGSILLNWAGTELVCPQGHGILYMADSTANSLDQDRWNKLDDSWQGLFRAN
jgi:hypothetical protein